MSVQDNFHCLMLRFTSLQSSFLIMTSVLSYCTINMTNECSPCYWLSHIFDTVPKWQTSTHFNQSINLINAHFIHRRTQKTAKMCHLKKAKDLVHFEFDGTKCLKNVKTGLCLLLRNIPSSFKQSGNWQDQLLDFCCLILVWYMSLAAQKSRVCGVLFFLRW